MFPMVAKSGAKTPTTVACDRLQRLKLALRLRKPSESQRLGLKLK